MVHEKYLLVNIGGVGNDMLHNVESGIAANVLDTIHTNSIVVNFGSGVCGSHERLDITQEGTYEANMNKLKRHPVFYAAGWTS
jgi:hypothetical protein